MIIPENKFMPAAITLSLADIGIDTKKVLDTTAVIGGGLADTIYLPFKDNDKLLSLIHSPLSFSVGLLVQVLVQRIQRLGHRAVAALLL